MLTEAVFKSTFAEGIALYEVPCFWLYAATRELSTARLTLYPLAEAMVVYALNDAEKSLVEPIPFLCTIFPVTTLSFPIVA